MRATSALGKDFRLLIVNADGEHYARELARSLPDLAFDWIRPDQPLTDSARQATALACFASALNNGLLRALPRLEWLQALSSGVDGIADHTDLPPDVALTSAHGIHGPAVSEMALTMMLALARDLPAILADQRARHWRRRRQPLLHGKTLAVLGTGMIASELASKCQALGMRTLAVSSSPRPVAGFDQVHARGMLRDVAAQADFLVLLAPLTPSTQGLVDAAVLAAMKPGAYLVNLARAGLCDTTALVDALHGDRLAGAALDVFEREPLPEDDPLWSVPKLLITPHIGGESDRYADQVLPLVAHNVRAWASGDRAGLRNRVR
ncbi:D-2-hydroxyacid dehydrogenase [Pigmentiphaga kullae]|uniref:Phosphoglycerate dehydrogenase-like enzyme n=1 Tax=Pigmentiphaga kullae TaxID=151784 RepID=A0A4Q7N9E2_9BURK|nr:D-2-hydroxyacid dehydrogenase [Pigmentiphaga kullae]RZS78755.1 phosphoglycerate dehydrogenase-like enzyme [Pigmentiphaga kullae]